MGLPRLSCLALALGLCLGLAPLVAAPASPGPGARLAEALASAKALLASPEAAARIGALADSLEPQDGLALITAVGPSVSDPGQSKALLQRGGRLALLLGSYAPAAELLEAAAFRLPASRDDALLLASARCRLAAGDSEKALDRASIVARSGVNPGLILGARLVTAWANLLKGEVPEARKLAQAILEGPGKALGASSERREGLFVLWAASAPAERPGLAASLGREYPGSPEAALVQGPGSATLLPLPHWYLSGVLVSQEASPPKAQTSPAPSQPSALPAAPAPAPGPSPGPQASPGPAAGEDSALRRFQVGIFADAQNAALLVAELAKKSLVGKLEKRNAGGRELFAVIVEGEAGATILRLKDAGYEAWPLF